MCDTAKSVETSDSKSIRISSIGQTKLQFLGLGYHRIQQKLISVEIY
jgi:hypothetical protein